MGNTGSLMNITQGNIAHRQSSSSFLPAAKPSDPRTVRVVVVGGVVGKNSLSKHTIAINM